MKYYRRYYTWLRLDAENRRIDSFSDAPDTKSVTKHIAPIAVTAFDSFVAGVDKDLIEVEDYDQYVADNPQTVKAIEITEQQFNSKRAEIINQLLNI